MLTKTFLGNRIEREICKNLPKRSIETHGGELLSTSFLFRVSFFFFRSCFFFFLSRCSFRFFVKQHTHARNAFASSKNGEFCEKAKQEAARVVLKGTRETFAAVKKRSRQRKAFVRETIHI